MLLFSHDQYLEGPAFDGRKEKPVNSGPPPSRNKLMAVVDADTGKVITTLPIGDHVDATAFDPETKLVFNSNGKGFVYNKIA